MTKGKFNINFLFYNFMDVIVFGSLADDVQVIENKDAKEECLAPLIDSVFDKVVNALDEYVVECRDGRFFVQKPGDGTRYELSIESALVLTPAMPEPTRIKLD